MEKYIEKIEFCARFIACFIVALAIVVLAKAIIDPQIISYGSF